MRFLSGWTNKARLALVVGAVSAGVLMATANPAGASVRGNFDASCGYNHSVLAEAADLSAYPGWTAVWYPILYRWNGSQWARYQVGPTQTQYSTGPDAWSVNVGWIVTSVRFNNLPTGYYQVRVTYTYYYNGRLQGTYADKSVVHSRNQADPLNYAVAANSTSAYCYEG